MYPCVPRRCPGPSFCFPFLLSYFVGGSGVGAVGGSGVGAVGGSGVGAVGGSGVGAVGGSGVGAVGGSGVGAVGGSGVGAVGGSGVGAVGGGGWRQHASRSPESKPWRSKSASLSRAEVSSVERDSSLRILRILLATSWREDITVWAGCVRRSVGGESSESDPEPELEVPEDSELFDSCLVFSKASPALALSSSTVGFGGSSTFKREQSDSRLSLDRV